MTNREPTAAELTERARQLSHEAEHMYGVIKRRRETMRTAKEQALAVTGEAASADGVVRVTVDAGGMLTKLVLAPDAGRQTPDQLAQVITSVTQQAAAEARAAVRQIYTQLRDEGSVRDLPVFLPEPTSTTISTGRPRRQVVDDEPSYEDARSMLRSEDW